MLMNFILSQDIKFFKFEIYLKLYAPKQGQLRKET